MNSLFYIPEWSEWQCQLFYEPKLKFNRRRKYEHPINVEFCHIKKTYSLLLFLSAWKNALNNLWNWVVKFNTKCLEMGCFTFGRLWNISLFQLTLNFISRNLIPIQLTFLTKFLDKTCRKTKKKETWPRWFLISRVSFLNVPK